MSIGKTACNILLIATAVIVLTGCTTAVDAPTRQIGTNLFTIHIPADWVELDRAWISNSAIAAFGNVKGSVNQASVVIYQFTNAIDTSREQFNQDWCNRYFNYSNGIDPYEPPPENYTINSTEFNQDNQTCTVRYNHRTDLGANAQYLDVVRLHQGDIVTVEGSAVEGQDFAEVERAVNSVTLR